MNDRTSLAPEILAPAGSRESLEAAVRCGANAVYLGGKHLNARRGASNFDSEQLAEAVSYCHARNVKVYLTLNTVVFDSELPLVEKAIQESCEAGIDAVIVQDLAVAALVRSCAPTLPLHASTQMSVHNADGAHILEELGFSRVVLARELSYDEINRIATETSIELECFVHGALCMCVSGQCYLSSMIGGRSGNRGLCAQPCRLPFSSGISEHALSLKDLSIIRQIPALTKAGVCSFKIEGRLKRPEYVAAAVTACRNSLDGINADYKTLQAVFSRNGFTSGYLDGELGNNMFGTRQKEDVASAAPVLRQLATLYRNEKPLVPVNVCFNAETNSAVTLSIKDAENRWVAVSGKIPLIANTAPTTKERVEAALSKTGGTPYHIASFDCKIDDGLMIPAAELNSLRRQALSQLDELRSQPKPHAFSRFSHWDQLRPTKAGTGAPAYRARVSHASQASPELAEEVSMLIVPAGQIGQLDEVVWARYRERLAIELPRLAFAEDPTIDESLRFAREHGISHALAGNIGGIYRARAFGFHVHGDWSLNISNALALEEYRKLGLIDITLGIECGLQSSKDMSAKIPKGIIAYGYLPLMITRNPPCGVDTSDGSGILTDRKNNRFQVYSAGQGWELLNCVPLYLGDRSPELKGLDFVTLYFTGEQAWECSEILHLYRTGRDIEGPRTRGLYYRKVE